MALSIGAVSLFAESIDFLEDTSVNLLIFIGLSWSATAKSRLAQGMALILLTPAIGFFWALWGKFSNPVPPEAFALSLTGLGALAINIASVMILLKYRDHKESLPRAAFLAARNDAWASLAIIAAGLITAFIWPSIWPDVIVGIGIAAMNFDAASKVWGMAQKEHASAKA